MTPQQEHIALQNFKTSMIQSGHGEDSYGGFMFEVPTGCYCPMKLRKDGSEAKRCGRKFWKAFSEWDKLSKEEKEATRV